MTGTNFRKLSATLLVGGQAIILSACGVGAASTDNATTVNDDVALPVEVIVPVKSEIFATYHATATLSSDADADVPARVEGEIVEILVEEGDQVVEGQLLARLDGERLRLAMLQARANLEKTKREHERYISLHRKGLVSSAALDEMKFDMEALRASHELKRLDYQYTNIRAPISGVVSLRYIKIGQHLNASETAFRITDISTLVAYLKIPQSELTKFDAGQIAEVRVDAIANETFSAEISRISPTIDLRNGTFRATAHIDNGARHLAPGMFGRFSIAYEKHSNALLIPVTAVVREDSQSIIYIVTEGEAVRRVIQTGIESDGVVEVLNGLHDLEQVVISGQGSIRDGSKVLAGVPSGETTTG